MIIISMKVVYQSTAQIDHHHHYHHCRHVLDWSVAISTSCLHRPRSWAHHHAEFSPWLSGWRSASRVRSQVWRGRLGRRLQSGHSIPPFTANFWHLRNSPRVNMFIIIPHYEHIYSTMKSRHRRATSAILQETALQIILAAQLWFNLGQ